KAALQAFLRGYFLANPRVEVLLDVESLELPVTGLARARIDLTVLPAGDRATLDVELREQGGEWRVTRADRVRPGDEGLLAPESDDSGLGFVNGIARPGLNMAASGPT